MQPPIAKKIPTILQKHNHKRIDNYFWLNQRDNDDVLEYLHKEQSYSDNYFQQLQPDIQKIYSEFETRIVKSRQTVPYFDNGYYYYYSYTEDSEYAVFRRSTTSAINLQTDEVVVDIQQLSIGTTYCSVGKIAVSPNNQMVVYSLDTVGRRRYDLYIKNLQSKEVKFLELPHKTTGNIVWSTDNETILYVVADSKTLRSFQVWTYNIHSKGSTLLYEEIDPTYRISIYTTSYKSVVFIASVSTLTTEIRVCSIHNPVSSQVVIPRTDGVEYLLYDTHHGYFVYTNYQAKNFRLLQIENSSNGYPVVSDMSQLEQFQEIIPHNEFVKLEQVHFFETFYIYQQRSNGSELLFIAKYDESIPESIVIPEKEYAISYSNNNEYSSTKYRYGLTTLRTPFSTYEFDSISLQSTCIKEEPLAIEYNKNDYETYRVYANTSDNTRIAISVVHRKDTKLDGTAPLLLYGYGSYGITIDPSFSSEKLSLLDRGFIYAIAHIRGEQFFGRQWYDDGKLLSKMNTFTDFIACAEELIAKKYTSASKLVAMGGSAGGLLMGAIANLRPDLFAGIVTLVPFVDVVTTMLDDTIPLTTAEYDEWGNPNDKEYYDYMLSYSPYDNIKPQNYPPMLVVTGYHDSQVQYWEPAKYVAKLRELKTDNNPLLFQINFEAGHGGASGRFSSLKEVARNYAFILNCVEKTV
jgi:oligopeptidase B